MPLTRSHRSPPLCDLNRASASGTSLPPVWLALCVGAAQATATAAEAVNVNLEVGIGFIPSLKYATKFQQGHGQSHFQWATHRQVRHAAARTGPRGRPGGGAGDG